MKIFKIIVKRDSFTYKWVSYRVFYLFKFSFSLTTRKYTFKNYQTTVGKLRDFCKYNKFFLLTKLFLFFIGRHERRN